MQVGLIRIIYHSAECLKRSGFLEMQHIIAYTQLSFGGLTAEYGEFNDGGKRVQYEIPHIDVLVVVG